MNQKTLIVSLLLVTLLLSSLASADLIRPGYRPITIENRITNVEAYTDYVFMSTGELGVDMCPVQIIEKEGKIPSYYKFCDVSIWAIKKSNFPQEKIDSDALNAQISEKNFSEEKKITAYLDSVHAQKVLEHINTYIVVPESSPETVRNIEYTISLDQVRTRPDLVTSENSILLYIYPSISFIALLLILFIGMRRKER